MKRLEKWFEAQEKLEYRQLLYDKSKLKTSHENSGFFAGFGLVALVEINLDDTLPYSLLIFYGLITVTLTSVHMIILMTSSCLLPHVERVS